MIPNTDHLSSRATASHQGLAAPKRHHLPRQSFPLTRNRWLNLPTYQLGVSSPLPFQPAFGIRFSRQATISNWTLPPPSSPHGTQAFRIRWRRSCWQRKVSFCRWRINTWPRRRRLVWLPNRHSLLVVCSPLVFWELLLCCDWVLCLLGNWCKRDEYYTMYTYNNFGLWRVWPLIYKFVIANSLSNM